MINIYGKNNTNYNTNGDATLIPIRADLTITLNGSWQLEVEVPYDKEKRYELIEEGAVIICDVGCIRELASTRQRFRIYDYKKGISSVTAIAFPVAMESTHDAPIDNLVISGKTGVQAMAQIQAKTSKYTLYSDITRTGSTSFANTNVNNAIASGSDGCFIDVWGGEIVYDNLKFSVLNRVGNNEQDKHKIIYGKDITDISYEKDDSGLITRIYPISSDGIRLNGSGYVDSPKVSQYPIVHSRYMSAPYKLIEDDIASSTATAQLTRSIKSQITTLASSLSHSIYNTAVASKVEPEYIRKIKADILSAVQSMATANIYNADAKKVMQSAIKDGMEWLKDVSKPEWTWHDAGNDAWWYGASESSRAVSEYVYVDRIWRYFGDNAYWQRPKDDDSKKWDWIQEASGKRYGNKDKYYAQKTYVYITMNGQMKEYWFDDDGYWDGSDDTDSSYAWHGSGTSADPWWFGEDGATSEDTNKFLHGGWWFIDGTYYYFDKYGYYDGTTKFENYQWDWVEASNSKWWFGNDANRNFARVYVTNQWLKVGGDWYRFDANGYAIGDTALENEVIARFTSGMAQLKTLCESLNTQAFNLLYSQMRSYCTKMFNTGIDVPNVTITVNMADLSNTSEYAKYQHLEKVYLGDSVTALDYKHNISAVERIVSITYDCIKKVNAVVEIGVASSSLSDILKTDAGGSVAGGFDTSVIENTLTTHTNELARLDREKQDELIAGDNIEIINNVISATGGGGQGLQYFVETPNSLYGRSDVDIMQDPAFVFDHQVSVTFRAQGGTHTWSTQAGVTTGIAETHVIRSLSANTWNGIFQVSDNPSDLSIYYKFVKDNWWDVDSEGTMTWDNCPNAMLYPCSSNLNAYGFKDTFEVDGKTYYIMTIGSNQIPFTTERIGTYASSTLYLPSYNRHAENPDRPDNGFYQTLGEFGDYLLSQSEDTYYNGLARSGKLAFFAGGEDANGTDAPIKIYADGTADGLVTQYDFENADFTGATSSEDGAHGLVPQPLMADKDKFLKGDGTWAEETDAIEELTDVNLTSVANGQILKYNSTTQKWENANESGGTTVVANPTGTATADLNKIQVDNTIYQIPQGGGGGGTSGGSAYAETVLWENAEGTTFYPQSPQTITLNDSIDNYDALLFDITTTESLDYHAPCICPVSAIIRNSNTMSGVYGIETQYTFSFKYSDTTHLILHGWASSYKLKAYKVTGIKYGGNLSPVIYSTEEREIGVWTDNKPLYQKTFRFNSLTSVTQNTWFDTGFTLNDCAIVGDATAFRDDNVAGQSFPIVASCDLGTNQPIEILQTRNTSIGINGFTIQYTKTTDVAGSGTYNTLGVPTVHYTTDEQVIGTWIDGKPLYRKTVIKSGTISQRETIPLGIANVENIFLVSDASNVNNGRMPLPLVTGTDNSNNTGGFFDIQQSDTSFLFRIGSGMVRNVENAIITVQYTKTTDV